MLTRNLERSFMLMWNSPRPFLAAFEECLSFALKWFRPVFLAKILPLLVTFRRLAKDLLVFIVIRIRGLGCIYYLFKGFCPALSPFNYNGHTLRTFGRGSGHFVFYS